VRSRRLLAAACGRGAPPLLSYYGRIARLSELEIHDDRCFDRLAGRDGDFTAIASTGDGRSVEYRCRKLVCATGVFGEEPVPELRDLGTTTNEHPQGQPLCREPAKARLRTVSIDPLLDALDGWLLQRNPDGSVVYKGKRLSASAFEILRLCDGTRRISGIIKTLAAAYGQPEDEIRDPALTLIVSLLRSGKLMWRVAPIPSSVSSSSRQM
jgi:hypothetical protein